MSWIPRSLAVGLTGAVVVLAGCSTGTGTGSMDDRSLPTPITDAVPDAPGRDDAGAQTVADGWLPDGESLDPFDTEQPAVARLEPDLGAALRDAAATAGETGVELRISSGWRSAALQAELLADAVDRYGSEEEARRWVNTPDRSTHVTGEAVDVASADASSWLAEHGEQFGLCQTYANERWHYELAVEPGDTCPAPQTDAAAG